jgi:hypothetical protein
MTELIRARQVQAVELSTARGTSRSSPSCEKANLGALGDLLTAIEAMELAELRELWRKRVGPPPKLRSPELLRLHLAWRIQGEHAPELVASLRQHLVGSLTSAGPSLPIGARLSREWGGKTHEVAVVEGGFHYAGRNWRSLSEIARAVTGVRWNGPRFFGLRAER